MTNFPSKMPVPAAWAGLAWAVTTAAACAADPGADGGSEDWLFTLRMVLAAGSGLVYWAGVWLQARRVRKRIRRSPNLRPRTAKERALWLGWAVVIAVWIAQPLVLGSRTLAPVFDPLQGWLHPAGLAAGAAMVVLGYLGTLQCYAAMGDTWRIGVDATEKTALVQSGPYRFLRHPIYSFQILMLAGVVALLPTPASLGALALHWLCVMIKAVDEERHLEAVHGAEYRAYLATTGRLLPRIGRRHG